MIKSKLLPFNVIFHDHSIYAVWHCVDRRDDDTIEITILFYDKHYFKEMYEIFGQKNVYFSNIRDALEYLEKNIISTTFLV